MLQTSVVQVSGRGTNVDFAIDDTSPFDQVVSELRKYLEENQSLWSKGNITVNAGLRMGSREQLTELKRLIEKESGLTVARFWCSSDTVDPGTAAGTSAGTSLGENQGRVRVQSPARPLPESPVPRAENPAPAKTITSVVDPGTKPMTPGPKLGVVAPAPALKARQRPRPRLESRTAAPHANLSVHEEPVSGHTVLVTPVPEIASRQIIPLRDERSEDREDNETSVPTFDYKTEDLLEYRAEYLESRRDTALFVKSTCRSGEIIRYSGDVVVLGDVNPGAEIVAGGDITVFGALRGIAHAGSGGLTKAAIIAFRLESPRLQIGPYVGLSSKLGAGDRKGAKSGASGPLIAFVRRRSIYVAEFAGRFARYSRGILYEG